MPTAPEVQASKTVNSLYWMSPAEFLCCQSKKPWQNCTWEANLKVRGATHWLYNSPPSCAVKHKTWQVISAQWPLWQPLKAAIFLCGGRPRAYTALGNYGTVLPSSAWFKLVLPLWVSSWASKPSDVIGSVLSIGSAVTLLCRTCQHHSSARSKTHGILVTGNMNSSTKEEITTAPCFCSVPHSFTYNINRKYF